MYLQNCRKEECCGCAACVNVCTHKAIDMVPDEEGFFYPLKNDKCTQCGLCDMVCPYNPINIEQEEKKQALIANYFPKAFAAYGKEDRIGSSSGGIFYTLSKHIISKNGSVYGAAFDKDFQLRHTVANTIEELQPLRGSKYLQSSIGDIFRDIRKKLVSGEYVMFVGTPCQVAGLKSYLRKDFETLLTADLICHGTPSQWMFDQHKTYIEKANKGKLISYHFRNEAEWGGSEIADFANRENGKKWQVKQPTYELSPYLFSFMYAFDYRLSCYECPFAKVPRQGDITLGDYWGIQKYFPEMDASKGISAILVNTPQGLKAWNAVKGELEWKESTYQDVGANNANLTRRTEKPSIRDNVYQMVRERGYADLANKEFRSPRYNKILFKMWLQKFYVIRIGVKIYRKIRYKI